MARISRPLATSQSLSVRSSLPDNTSLPPGEKATEVTDDVWPSWVTTFVAHFKIARVFDFSWM